MARRLLAGSLAGVLLLQSVVAFTFPPGKLELGPVDPPDSWGALESELKGIDPVHSPSSREVGGRADAGCGTQVLEDAFYALTVLQNSYFDAVNGTWPSSIDWTGAVVETVVAGMLTTLTQSLWSDDFGSDANWKQKENLVSSVYAQVVHSFFGQNAQAIKDQAYDDMLWVVLGWVEATKFVKLHSELHYPGTEHDCKNLPTQLGRAMQTSSWQGHNWLCTFAGRARAFWDLSAAGWDTKLCHGGMIWNPRLIPYKNAITNELWISASIAMYQQFPNDTVKQSWAAKDHAYLTAATEGYKWLQGVNMTNKQGLYVDGYHVDGSKPGNVECDQRDEMVYTYNQGVILTGQRGLWCATGSASYLEEGHRLIRSVITATGWDLDKNTPVDTASDGLPPWRGIGRGGVLEEQCDAGGTCSQDAQTFKGIFFHHLTAFCAPIEPIDVKDGMAVNARQYRSVKATHDKACGTYLGWVKHNVDAAMKTRDGAGRFGMWWGAGARTSGAIMASGDGIDHMAPNTTDYRNKGTPQDETWGSNKWEPGSKSVKLPCADLVLQPSSDRRELRRETLPHLAGRSDDPNDRGRGRTVETQAGAIALLRAYWELSQSR
ncbi:Uncharacterized protein TPAR_00682 [Tolypocladium paradoxum]|uniref:Glycosyl hydrolase n=1 Tax=Tolypocladium paradoxum TaxID=94208 RepID=A0A2S4L9L8_9HYPO|nr:Uncharacterized protein TPAR_00682 [Tolypocladium paradoxum]